MTVKKQESYNIIDTLPDELLTKVIDYIEYLKFTAVTNQAPESVIVKDEDDLREKLQKGIEAMPQLQQQCYPLQMPSDKIPV